MTQHLSSTEHSFEVNFIPMRDGTAPYQKHGKIVFLPSAIQVSAFVPWPWWKTALAGLVGLSILVALGIALDAAAVPMVAIVFLVGFLKSFCCSPVQSVIPYERIQYVKSWKDHMDLKLQNHEFPFIYAGATPAIIATLVNQFLERGVPERA